MKFKWLLIALCLSVAGFAEPFVKQIRPEVPNHQFAWETKPDFERCRAIYVEAFSKAYSGASLETLKVSNLQQFLEDAFDESYQELQSSGSQIRWICAKHQGKTIGFLSIDCSHYPREIYLQQMAIDPSWQRRGIGSGLISAILRDFPAIERLVVITRKVNTGAKSFYRSLGFSESAYMHAGYDPARYEGFELIVR